MKKKIKNLTKKTQKAVSHHCTFVGTIEKNIFLRVYRDDLKSTVTQKLKIRKLIIHSFQNITQQFRQKEKKRTLFEGGERGLNIDNRNNPKY